MVSCCSAREAAMQATSSPLLEVGIEQATGIVWNITGPEDMTLYEVGSVPCACNFKCSMKRGPSPNNNIMYM